MNILRYFTDPVLQAPTLGSMLMCLSAALVGVVVVLKRRSLLGEALSHASYPGVVISIFILAAFFPAGQDWLAPVILLGAFTTALLGLFAIELLERRLKIKNDAALCFVLSIFFGVGVLFASRLQFEHALWYKTMQVFLFGQAATMNNTHVILYAALAALTIAILLLKYYPIKLTLFDRDYAKTVGVRLAALDALLFVLIAMAIVIGIRSVGVVLMAGMLIAPAVAAKQLTHRLKWVFILAGVVGALSGFLGNYLSLEIPAWGSGLGWKFTLPTGPMILLSASSMSLLALLFAPKQGLVGRKWRIATFRWVSQGENLLKFLWKKGDSAVVRFTDLRAQTPYSSLQLWLLLSGLQRQGWIKRSRSGGYALTSDGVVRAGYIVRLHRLWEVYLVHLGQGVEKVHCRAEEMEHILTPELEQQLVDLLNHPKQDPHHQPIPYSERLP